MCNDPKQLMTVTGVLQIFVEILRTGHRDDLLPRATQVFDQVLK